MLTFLGLDGDVAAERGAKLKALQAYFKESDPRAFNMLGATELSTSNKSRGKRLIVNSHGNVASFAGQNPDAFFALLQGKGFGEGSFDEVWLMACQVGAQNQTNTIADNFARDLKRVFVNNGITAKLYAPRGTLTYQVHTQTESGQTYYVVDAMVIACPERNYPLSEGMLLVGS